LGLDRCWLACFGIVGLLLIGVRLRLQIDGTKFQTMYGRTYQRAEHASTLPSVDT